MAKIAEDAIVWCVIVSLFFAGPGVFAFGGPLPFLRRGIAAVKQYLKQRKQPEEKAGIRKCLWKGIGSTLFGTLGIVVVVYLFAGAVTSGMIFVILYFLIAGPALLFWAAVLLWLHLRARRKPEQGGKTKHSVWVAVFYLLISLPGILFWIVLKTAGPYPLDF